MEIIPSHILVSDFCEQMENGAIEVNHRYQRSDRVWPDAAQSFLIETILRGFPVPKLFLHQKTDRVSRKSVRQIIDGQQRATAIRAFYDGALRLSRTLEVEEIRACTYSELSEDLQARFLNFPLAIDLFTNASDDDVREVFRRINSYEVPLNAEEQRHARYQGQFKWFIYHLSSQYDSTLYEIGALSEKLLVRMADMKLFAEITHAALNGITTTNKRDLDKLYRENDRDFSAGPELTVTISVALERVGLIDTIHRTPLMRTYSLYALVLALMHVERALPELTPVARGGVKFATDRVMERRLLELSEAVTSKDEHGPLGPFVKATLKSTNVREQRETRFQYFVDAVAASGGRLIP